MDGRTDRRHDRTMPLDLSDAELATAAQACRAMAHQEAQHALTLAGNSMRAVIEKASNRYAALAEKLEAARKK